MVTFNIAVSIDETLHCEVIQELLFVKNIYWRKFFGVVSLQSSTAVFNWLNMESQTQVRTMSTSRSPERRLESSSKSGNPYSSRSRSPLAARKKPAYQSSKKAEGSFRRRTNVSQSPSPGTSSRRHSRSHTRSCSPHEKRRYLNRRHSPSSSRSRSPHEKRLNLNRRHSPSSSRSRSPHEKRRTISRRHSPSSRSPHEKRRKFKTDRSRSSRTPSYKSNRSDNFESRYDPKPSKCLGVFGLSVETTSRDLKRVFEKYGSIEHVKLITDSMTHKSRGFAFITFDNIDDASEAKKDCEELVIDRKHIRVDFSITKRAHTPTPGIYMGRPTRSFGGSEGGGYSGGSSYGGGSRYRSPSSRGRRGGYDDYERPQRRSPSHDRDGYEDSRYAEEYPRRRRNDEYRTKDYDRRPSPSYERRSSPSGYRHRSPGYDRRPINDRRPKYDRRPSNDRSPSYNRRPRKQAPIPADSTTGMW